MHPSLNIFIVFLVTSMTVESFSSFVAPPLIIVIFLFLKFSFMPFTVVGLFLPDIFALVQKIGKLHFFIICFGISCAGTLTPIELSVDE